MKVMCPDLDVPSVAALTDQPLDWRYKGIPASWWGRTPAQVRAAAPDPFDDGAVGPLCVLRDSALAHNLKSMAEWCRARDVELANEVVDDAGVAWLGRELDAHPDFGLVCWVDSVRGVELMTAALTAAGVRRQVGVCVEVGVAGGRTGCRGAAAVDEVARAAADSERLRLVGVAGYEAAVGHDVTPAAYAGVRAYLREVRGAVTRLAGVFEADEVVVTAGGSTYFDAVADELTGGWPAGLSVRTILRSGCYLTHDDGLYRRTSPLHGPSGLRPALTVWAQVVSRPEPDLALLTMGRRDVSFDADLPVPYGLADSRVTKLNDQHAYLRLGIADRDRVEVGSWIEFGISHPCTVFDKWQLIPVLDDDGRVVDLIRTFF